MNSTSIQGDQVQHAFLWRNGLMTDLKTVAGDSGSVGNGINAGGQVVGQSCPSEGNCHAFLWENGGPMVNLQDLTLPGADLSLGEALFINDRGEILSNARLPNDDHRPFLLIPCDDNHPGIEGRDYTLVETVASADVHPAQPAQTDPSASTAGKVYLAESIASYRQFVLNRHRLFAGTEAQ
jgi:probable HAF family extracellular repeat protein